MVAPLSRLNGESFAVSQMEPFGVELQPKHGSIDFQNWIQYDIEQLSAAVRDHLLVVVRDVTTSPDQLWYKIDNPTKVSTTRLPHANNSGQTPILMWTLRNGVRGPTQFFQRDAVARAMQRHKGLLDSIEEGIDPNELCVQSLREFRDSLDGPTDAIDVNVPHGVNRTIFESNELDRLARGISGGPSLMDKIIATVYKRKHEQKVEAERLRVASLDRCTELIEQFSEAIIATLNPDAHMHEWSQKQDAGILAYNAIRNTPEGIAIPSALHRGVPQPGMSYDGELYRACIRNGTIDIRRKFV